MEVFANKREFVAGLHGNFWGVSVLHFPAALSRGAVDSPNGRSDAIFAIASRAS
jgi:hypothetical protein